MKQRGVWPGADQVPFDPNVGSTEVRSMDFAFGRVAGGRVIKCLAIEGVADDPPYDLVQGAGFYSMRTGP
jgi:hypothetical protein